MKRFLTLALLFCFLMNGLFAQKTRKNPPQSFLTLETGLSFNAKPNYNFSIPLNIEFQRVKNKWGLGVALGLDIDQYSEGDCNNRFETGAYAKLGNGLNGGFGNIYHYCKTTRILNFKPSVFGSHYFLQKRKVNLFAKLGLTTSILELDHISGEYFEYDPQSYSSGFYKITNGDPIHRTSNYHYWEIQSVDLLSGLGMNYTLNKRTSLRLTLQTEVNIPFLTRFLYEDKGFWVTGLCGLSFKI